MLKPDSGIPLYRQLADELEARIVSGKLRVGERIPSEPSLAQTYGIGRPTVRQATDYLMRRGLLERRRGAGTFVLTPREQVDLFQLAGTRAAFEAAGLDLEMTVIEPLAHVKQLGADAGPLAMRSGFTYVRLGKVDAVPILLERVALCERTFPGFERHPVESESLARIVERHYRLRPSGGQQSLRVVTLSAATSKLLRVKLGHPALLVERKLDFPGAPGSVFVESYVLTDRVALSQTLTEPQGDFFMALLPKRSK